MFKYVYRVRELGVFLDNQVNCTNNQTTTPKINPNPKQQTKTCNITEPN